MILKKIFSFKDFDSHYIFNILGLKIAFKHKCVFAYKEATEYGILREKRQKQLIVSLTSFPARINTAHRAINTLLCQVLKPDRLILWLADSQFPNKENDLPAELLKLKDFGLEIIWCEDLKSYKKLVPALKMFPNDFIITADDDIYYEEDWLKVIYETSLKNPECIVVNRPIRVLPIDNSIIMLSSRKSEGFDLSVPDFNNQMLGGSGCLYPPCCLHDDVFNKEKFTRMLPSNDDVYFWAMAVLKGTKIAVAKGFNGNLYQMDLKESSLYRINSSLDRSPFDIILEEYPQIYDILVNQNK